MKRKTATQFLWALCLITVGVILLLVNLDLISFEFKQIYLFVYPFVLALYGLYLFLKSFPYRDSGDLFWGLFISVLSGFLIADRFDLIEFRFLDFWKLWPVIFIAIAFNMIFFKKKIVNIEFEKKTYKVDDENDGWDDFDNWEYKYEIKSKSSETDVNIFGLSISDKKFKDPNWLLEPMNLSSVICDYYFDFSKAFIPEGETPVKVKGKVGQIVMLIPEDLPIQLTVKNSIGNISVFGQDMANTGSSRTYSFVSPNYNEATRKLKLNVKLTVGSIEIVKV